MSDKMLLQKKTTASQKRWDDLSEKISKLQQQMDLETRADEKMRLEEVVRSTEMEREEVEKELTSYDQQLQQSKKEDLIRDALRTERNDAYQEAAKLWELVRECDPEDSRVDRAIQRLEERQQQSEKISASIKELSHRMLEIKPIFAKVTRRLQQMGDSNSSENLTFLPVVENFLAKKLTPEEFMQIIQEMDHESKTGMREEFDFKALASRLKRGEIVLFFGSDIPRLTGVDAPDVETMVSALAHQANYDDFSGPLSMIAEYYQMKPEYGRRSLELYLQEMLPSVAIAVPLYELLAQVEQPLVLISAAYDTLLESAFRRAGKKFALICALISTSPDYPVGNILIRYSDKDDFEQPCLEQELSQHKLLDAGYTIIYKVRGYCHFDDNQDSHEHTCLALSEDNYLTFARYADKLIPSYITRQFIGRGLLFLGYSPKQWEDRLIVNAILRKRHNPSEPSSIIGGTFDRFESAFWDSRNVRRHALELNDFVTKLEDNF